MTADQRFEQDLPALLTDLALPVVPSYRDEIVRQIEASPQRPAWTIPERWIPVDTTMRRLPVVPINWRLLALAAALVLAAVAAALIAAGSRSRLPAPPYGLAANGLIAFEQDGDIHLGDPSTGTSRAIVSGPEVDSEPLFSRDGTQLVFKRRGIGLYLAAADGSLVRPLTDERQLVVTPTDWSGDGRFIVGEVWTGRPSIVLIDVETGATDVLDLAVGATGPIFRPPDGDQIAFRGGQPGAQGIYLVNRDGGGSHEVAAGDFTELFFSPDGARIASSLTTGIEGRGSEIHIIEPDGAGDRVLPNPEGVPDQWDPRWLPDGEHLAVVRSHDGWRLAVIPVEGGLGDDFHYMLDVFGTLNVSPDGQMAVFSPDDVTHPATIYPLAGPYVTGPPARNAPPWIAGSWQRNAVETSEEPTPAPGGP
jgi:hypothetical protein